MKFNFKIQQYRTDAVEAVIQVFAGQRFQENVSYIRDVGNGKAGQTVQMRLDFSDARATEFYDPQSDSGYRNDSVQLTDEQLLLNIQTLQSKNNIKRSSSLNKDLGSCSLDIEMEAGTGKPMSISRRCLS